MPTPRDHVNDTHEPPPSILDLTETSTLGLLRLYADILTALNSRHVIRTRNAPAGDLAEYLTAAVYDGDLAPNSKKSWDVKTPDGRLIQVKSRVLAPGEKSRNYSPFRSWGFHTGVFIHFDALTYCVTAAIEAPMEVIRDLSTPNAHVGTAARRLTIAKLARAQKAAATLAETGGATSPFVDRTSAFAAALNTLTDHYGHDHS